MTAFNVDHGFLEGWVRGMRNDMLKGSNYAELIHCETLEDLRLRLHEKDYAKSLSGVGQKLNVALVRQALEKHLCDDFALLHHHARPPLKKFLDYVTYSYMIDNVLLAIVGTKHGHKMEQLRVHFHPLGLFDQLESVPAASSPDEAFRCILADTPLADYYDECHAELDLSEKSIEVLRNSLHKAYIQDFTRLCADIGGGTEEVMSEILAFEADRRSIVLTVNSFGTGLTKTERRALFPQCGRLAPYGLQVLAEADDVDGVMQLSFLYPQYDALLERDAETGRLNEEAFNRHEVKLNLEAFWRLGHFGIFHAYVKLREQEVRNIVWIAECIAQRNRRHINDYLPID